MFNLKILFTKTVLVELHRKKNQIEFFLFGPLGAISKQFQYHFFFLPPTSGGLQLKFRGFDTAIVKTYISLLVKAFEGVYLG